MAEYVFVNASIYARYDFYLFGSGLSRLGLKEIKYETASTWFKGDCSIITIELEELLGTKLRALYQRRKGRDLFDIWWSVSKHDIDVKKLLHCYSEYMKFVVNKPPTTKQFLHNLEEKINDDEFKRDIIGLLRPGVEYSQTMAYNSVKDFVLKLK